MWKVACVCNPEINLVCCLSIIVYIRPWLINCLLAQTWPSGKKKVPTQILFSSKTQESSWLWSYGSWIYNFLCNQCLSPLKSWVQALFMARSTWCNSNQVYQWLAIGRWFSPVSSTNKTDRHNITEILLKVVLNTINQKT